MIINQTSVNYSISGVSKDEDNKISMGEYKGATGLASWLWCDTNTANILIEAEGDEVVDITLYNEDLESKLEVIENSVNEFLDNCEI